MKNKPFKKAIFVKKEKKFKIIEDSINNELKKDNLRIKVNYVGICGSDLHNYFKTPLRGRFNEWLKLSNSDGHEALGEVLKIGEDVKNFEVGNKIVMEAVNHCSKCNMCLSGNYHLCKLRTDLPWLGNGAFSEIIEVPAKVCYKIPNSKNLDLYTLSEPVASAIHAYNKINLFVGTEVLVIGSGTIGIILGILLKNNKNIKTTLGFKNQTQSNVLKKLNINSLNTVNRIQKYNSKYDLIFETSGNNEIIDDCIFYTKKGGSLVIVGASNSSSKFTYGQLLNKELKIIASLCYGWKNNSKEFQSAIEFISNNKSKLKKLITNIYDLRDINKAFSKAVKSNSIKVLLKP